MRVIGIRNTLEFTVHKASFIIHNATMEARLNEALADVTRRAFVEKPLSTSVLP